jgi:hypothetical protein
LATDTPNAVIKTMSFDVANTSLYFGGNGGTDHSYKLKTKIYPTFTVSNNLTVGDGSHNITLNANASSSEVSVTGNFTINSSGVFLSATATTTITGNFTNNGTFTNNSGTVVFNATTTGKTVQTNGGPFYNLTFNGSGGGWTLMDNSTTTNVLALTAGTLNASGTTITLTGMGTPFSVSGTFTASSSTVSFNGTTGTTSIPSLTYYNLFFSPSTGTPEFLLATSTLTINNNFTSTGTGTALINAAASNTPLSILGNFTIGSGHTFSAATSATTTITGNFTNSGTFTHNNGMVVFDGSATSTISSAASMSFGSFTVTTNDKPLVFQKHSANTPTFTFTGTLTLQGSSGHNITVQSNTPGSQWLGSLTNANAVLAYVFFTDSGCAAGTENMPSTNSTIIDNVNNGSCWGFLVSSSARTGGGPGGGASNNPTGDSGGGDLETGSSGGNSGGVNNNPTGDSAGGDLETGNSGGGGGGSGGAAP